MDPKYFNVCNTGKMFIHQQFWRIFATALEGIKSAKPNRSGFYEIAFDGSGSKHKMKATLQTEPCPCPDECGEDFIFTLDAIPQSQTPPAASKKSQAKK